MFSVKVKFLPICLDTFLRTTLKHQCFWVLNFMLFLLREIRQEYCHLLMSSSQWSLSELINQKVPLNQRNFRPSQEFMCPDLFFQTACMTLRLNHRSDDSKLIWVLRKERITVFQLERNGTRETNVELQPLNKACDSDDVRFVFNHFIYQKDCKIN